MKSFATRRAWLLGCLAALGCIGASAQTASQTPPAWPSKPVKFVNSWPAGGPYCYPLSHRCCRLLHWLCDSLRRLDHRRLLGFGHFLLQQRFVGRLQLGGGLVRFLGDFGLALLGWTADLTQYLVVERAGTDR